MGGFWNMILQWIPLPCISTNTTKVRNIYVCNQLQRVRIGFATLLKYMYINISYFYSPTKNTCNTHTHTHTHIYTRLKIKPNSVRIRFQSCQIFVLPQTGFEPTPLIHCSTIRLSLRPAPQTTRPHPLLKKRSFNNRSVTFSRKANLGIAVKHVYKRV